MVSCGFGLISKASVIGRPANWTDVERRPIRSANLSASGSQRVAMPQPVALTSNEQEAILLLGRRIKAARLRRNISQEEMARRAGVTRKTYADLEAGKPTIGLSILVKTMMILGYLDRIGDLLAADPIGEDIEAERGRQRASPRSEIADF